MSQALAPHALLQLLWLASPALPVGSYSYSEALEAAIDSGNVQGEAGVAAWLSDQLQLAQARADLALIAQAIPAWTSHDAARLAALNDWVHHARDGSEARQQSTQMGRSLTDWLRQRAPDDERVATLAALQPAPTWPLAAALAAAVSGAPPREALLALAFGWAENMVQAALKAAPLGQSAGQRVLETLADAIPGAVDQALTLADEDRQVCAPMLAILAAQHETQYSRLFRS